MVHRRQLFAKLLMLDAEDYIADESRESRDSDKLSFGGATLRIISIRGTVPHSMLHHVKKARGPSSRQSTSLNPEP